MNHGQSHPAKAVVFAYFARRATVLERKAIETWLSTDEGTTLYYTYLDEWERQYPQFYPDTDAARLRFAQFRQNPGQVNVPPIAPTQLLAEPIEREPTHWLTSRWFIGLAASVLLLMGLWLTFDAWYYTTQTNGYRQIWSVSLPNGSGVLLGPTRRCGTPGLGSRGMSGACGGHIRLTTSPDDEAAPALARRRGHGISSGVS